MSLVYEALQKAGREKDRKTGATAPASSVVAPAPVPQPVRPAAPAPQVVTPEPVRAPHHLLTALIVCVGSVALVAIVYLVSTAARTPSLARPVETPAPPPQVAAPVAPAPTDPGPSPAPANTANDPRYRLTGITGNSEVGYGAIINGKVVSQDQYVDGAIVKKVLRDRVTLNFNGQEIVLRLF